MHGNDRFQQPLIDRESLDYVQEEGNVGQVLRNCVLKIKVANHITIPDKQSSRLAGDSLIYDLATNSPSVFSIPVN